MSAAERLKYYTPAPSVLYPHRYTVAEYLAIAASSDTKLEYVAGYIITAEASDSYTHAVIAANLLHALHHALQGKPCKALGSDLKVATDVSFRYPDALVVCGEPQFYENKNTILTNPIILAEVVSSSSNIRDYVTKRLAYFGIASLRHYLVVEQDVPTVSVYSKTADGILLFADYDFKNAHIPLAALDISLTVNDIFEGVVFG